jgi:hypothetical protein
MADKGVAKIARALQIDFAEAVVSVNMYRHIHCSPHAPSLSRLASNIVKEERCQ